MKEDVIQTGDVRYLFGVIDSARVRTSHTLLVMKNKQLIMSLPDKSRKYAMRFTNKHLPADVLKQMGENGLLSLAQNGE